MRILFLGISALLVGSTTADCPRSKLQEVASKYLETVTQDGNHLALSTPFIYTENFKPRDITSGVLDKAIKIDHNRTLLDSPGCSLYIEVIAPNNKPQYHLGTQISVDSQGKATKVEVIVNSDIPGSDSWVFNATRTLAYILNEEKEGGRAVIPEAKRDSRETLKKAADAYFDLFSNGNLSSVPFGKGCTRTEGGYIKTLPCDYGIPTTPGGKNLMTQRRYVIDETVGSVDVFVSFAGSPDSHDFRLENGRIRYVHAITVMNLESAKGLGGTPKGI